MSAAFPVIQKIPRLHGKNIILVDVQVEDAEFILSLRLDPRKSRHLSAVEGGIEKQREWIRQYRQSEGQAYFIICDRAGEKLGTVRIYDAADDSFSWGSWIMKDGAPPSAGIESAVLVYQLATISWGFSSAHFQVRPANASVLAFHEKFGAKRVQESPQEIRLVIGKTQIERSLRRYARYLPEQLLVE